MVEFIFFINLVLLFLITMYFGRKVITLLKRIT